MVTRKNDWLQALRAIAALAVLFFHMAPHWEASSSLKPLTGWLQWGFAGVDIFFVLSGYVVYQSADRLGRAGPGFMARRGLRIYLGYWPVLVLTALMTVLTADAWPTGEKVARSALLLSPVIFDNWVPTAWSLTYELYFYLWTAIIFTVPSRWRLHMLTCVIAVVLAWNLGWYFWAYGVVYVGNQPLRFALTGLGVEFLAGALWAHFRARHPAVRAPALARGLLVLGMLMVVAGLALSSRWPKSDQVEILRAATFGAMGFGCLLVALAVSDLTKRSPPRLAVRLGDASYSLYLLHPLLLDIGSRIRFGWLALGEASLLIFLLALPVAICAVSLWWFRWVERPLFEQVAGSAWVKRLSNRRPTDPADAGHLGRTSDA